METIEIKWNCESRDCDGHHATIIGQDSRTVAMIAFEQLMLADAIDIDSLKIFVNGQDETVALCVAMVIANL